MLKKSLTECKMSNVAYLDEATKWSKDLTSMRSRGGDVESAMRSIERDYGVDYWTLWTLRYRRSKIRDIGVGAYMALKAAYRVECERQLRKLKNEISATEKITGPDSNAVRAAKALVGEDD